MDFRFMALSLRGSEATEAKQGEAEASLVIHKKVDSSMDRHALQSKARDDGKTRNAQNLNTPQDSRICDEKPLLCKASAEIRLVAYRTSEPQQSKVYRAKPNPKTKGGKL